VHRSAADQADTEHELAQAHVVAQTIGA